MRGSAALVAVALAWGTVAQARPPRVAPAEASAPEQPAEPVHVAVPNEDVPAQEPTSEQDDLWVWISRLEGEVPTEEAIEAIREKEDEQFAELALIERLGGVDVPTDYYADPKRVLKVDPLHLDKIDPSEFDIPIVVNDDVVKWMRYFTGPGRKYYTRWLTRSSRYRPMMYEQLEAKGLPRDLVYLSMIESGYNPHAYSHADAAGLWQFIPSTARLYRMRVDFWVDDRRDPERSTEAGLAFLTDLYKMFGDWPRAWAAYNTGPGRVKRASEKAGTTDYWVLVEKDLLHPETANYVPKIMAAAIIGKHPERYGFTDIAYQDVLAYEKVRVDGTVDMEVLARCAGTTVAELAALNPALRRGATPPEGYELRVPTGRTETFAAALAKVPKAERVATTQHKVQRGETLSTIARKYGTSTQDIARANRLRDADVIRVGQVLVIPTKGGGAAVAAADPKAAEPPPRPDTQKAVLTTHDAAPAKPKTYTVRAGDTLSVIASRHGVDVAQLKAWNGLRSDTIYVGQVLKLGSGSSGAVASAPAATKKTYTVQRGDTLSGIASKHGVGLADLQKWNKIANASSIQVGQQLVIYVSDSGFDRYTVKAGDSLGAIATRYGCSVSDLQAWNGIDGTVIHPGQVLKVRRG